MTPQEKLEFVKGNIEVLERTIYNDELSVRFLERKQLEGAPELDKAIMSLKGKGGENQSLLNFYESVREQLEEEVEQE